MREGLGLMPSGLWEAVASVLQWAARRAWFAERRWLVGRNLGWAQARLLASLLMVGCVDETSSCLLRATLRPPTAWLRTSQQSIASLARTSFLVECACHEQSAKSRSMILHSLVDIAACLAVSALENVVD